MSKLPCALTIAGLDPGGGAGIAADLRAFARAGAFGCAAIALTTVQSTRGLSRVVPFAAELVLAQAREVLVHQDVRAVKLGALGSRANVAAVAALLEERAFAGLPVVLDPVMVPSKVRGEQTKQSNEKSSKKSREDARGHGCSSSAKKPRALLDESALAIVRKRLLPRATVVTANTDEASALTGIPIRTLEDASTAAFALCMLGARAALVKGGHLRGDDATDVIAFADGRMRTLSAPRLPIERRLHGGGCTLASLIAGRLAVGDPLDRALPWAKRTLQRALERLVDVGPGPLAVITL